MQLSARFSSYAKHGSKFERAIRTVCLNSVKQHLFLPSGRSVFTVVGSNYDEFIDPDRSFCSCSNHFFKVMKGSEDFCYHILSYRIAAESKMVDTIEFSDDEYPLFLRAVAKDVFANLRDRAEEKPT